MVKKKKKLSGNTRWQANSLQTLVHSLLPAAPGDRCHLRSPGSKGRNGDSQRFSEETEESPWLVMQLVHTFSSISSAAGGTISSDMMSFVSINYHYSLVTVLLEMILVLIPLVFSIHSAKYLVLLVQWSPPPPTQSTTWLSMVSVIRGQLWSGNR